MTASTPCVAIVLRSSTIGGHSIEQVFVNHAAHLEGVTAEIIELDNQDSLWQSLRKLRRYSLIHITGHVNWLINCLFWKRSILTIHDIGRYRELVGLKKWVYYLWWIALPVFFARRVTVVSKYTRDQLAGICPFARNKIEVVYNSVPSQSARSPRRDNPIPRILQVGTAVHKNAEGTIAALEGLNAELVLIGKRRAELEELLDQTNVVCEWLTDIPYHEVMRQYEGCDVVAFPSFHEGFGLPIIEAQVVGRPIVTSSVCSLPEVGGDGALYVDPHDVAAIRRAITSLIDDSELWNETVERGQRNLDRFEPTRLSAQLAELYRQALEHDASASTQMHER